MNIQQENTEFIKVSEFAKAFRVDKQTVRNMINDGRLNGFKVGNCYRIDKSEMDKIIAATHNKTEVSHG